MPTSGEPVYQPTTVSVSYEPRTSGGGGVVPDTAMRLEGMLRRPRPRIAILLFALIALASGVAMLASGFTDWPDDLPPPTTEAENSSTDDSVSACVRLPVGMIVGGVLVILTGLIAMGIYMKLTDWRRCVCSCPFFDKKQSLARQLQCQSGGSCGQGIMALNPSTDPLVSHTQYAPVSELPLRLEDEERRNLMPDNKDCLSSAEESDRMLEPDPRIVLRPMGRVDDA